LAEIRNPNLQTQGPAGSGGGGGDMRIMMTFTMVALIVLLAFDYFRPKPAAPAPPAQTQQQAQQQTAPSQLTPGSVQAAAPVPAAQQALPATPQISSAAETETTVENSQYRIVFTNKGAQVKHWILKHYNDSNGKPLDLVQAQAAARFGLPLSLYTYHRDLDDQLNRSLYQMTVTGAQPSATGLVQVPATSAITFHYAANGLDVVKTFRFDSSYVVKIESLVTRNGSPVQALVQWPSALGDMEEFQPPQPGSTGFRIRTSINSMFAWSIDGKQDSLKASKVSGNATQTSSYDYAAVADLYFAAAFLPDTPSHSALVTLHNTIELPKDLNDPNSPKTPADVIGLAVGDQTGPTRLRLFVGPKELDVLKSVRASAQDGTPSGPTLEPLIQYTWLAVIAKPLYLALRFLRNMLGSGDYTWGWAIIILTFFINLCMLPTRMAMMKSSLKMMRIQPKVEVLKRKYAHLKATDPKKAEMNTEMMALYKTEGVNMYGSCLPMLIQMPLLYGIYRVLANAVELRQAHWFWLTDLSSADPLHILPILIIVSMFLVQIITPAAGMDPAQRRMMAFMMPVMMGFMMWQLPSGLSLYWGTGNLINLAMQLAINQSRMGKEMHAIAAKRSTKKPGPPTRTIQGKR
jgi:YidC/Oxa1 family membrane protein insertase